MEDCTPGATDNPEGVIGEGLEKAEMGVTATGLETVPGWAEEVLGPNELTPACISAEAVAGGA